MCAGPKAPRYAAASWRLLRGAETKLQHDKWGQSLERFTHRNFKKLANLLCQNSGLSSVIIYIHMNIFGFSFINK